jgi:hypothetical protein
MIKRIKKLSILALIAFFLNTQVYPLYAYTQVPAYLCELGIQFYNQGNYAQALHEFNKALMARPGYPLALEYIGKIQKQATGLESQEEIISAATLPSPVMPTYAQAVPPPASIGAAYVTRAGAIKEFLDKIEGKTQQLPLLTKAAAAGEPGIAAAQAASALGAIPVPELPRVLYLNEDLNTLTRPLEIEQGKSLIIAGNNIGRFLATYPDTLAIERQGSDELLVTGKDFGFTNLHVWDSRGRWTLDFLTVPPRPTGPTLEEQMRLQELKAQTFRLRYNMDWSSFEKGRRIDALERQSYGYTHSLRLEGQIPYGDIDSAITVRSLRQTTDLTSLNLALTNGMLGQFKGFTLRAFDYATDITNLSFSNVSLRGIMLDSPAFHDRLDYVVFWGREGGGRYGNLSPGITKTKNSFLSGMGLNFSPWKKQDYSFTVVHGWGRDRPNDLNSYGYDLDAEYRLGKLGLDYEIAHDSETFAHLVNLDYSVPRLKLTTEVRNTSRDFKTMTGWGWRVGELGALSTLFYTPTEKLAITGRLDVFQDRLYPNPENENRWNEDFSWDATYLLSDVSSLRLDYTLQNELARISESRSHNLGIGLNRSFDWIRKLYTYAYYRHQESKNFTSHSSDYINDKVYTGVRFSLIGALYYYINREYNWLEERFNGNFSQPKAMETGVDWSGQILKTPLYGNMRCIYRQEKDTSAPLSFLAGEDYLEGFAELSYRPTPEKELFCSSRVRNVWAGDNADVEKRVEADFHAGMRYLWDTGVRWDSVGTIEGYVFNDLNGDGLRQSDEPPVEGVKIWLGKDKSEVTDILGYYKFPKVKAKKAYPTIDSNTIPGGFTLTGPATQEAVITHGYTARINFGIASRSEIIGVIFDDTDKDGQFGSKDIPVRGVVLMLEDGSKAITNDAGRFSFRKAATGKHTIAMDLNSLPPVYMPAVAIFKDIELFEGMSYNYNIPLKRIRE